MPIKLMVLVKRKVGMSPEEFRAGYENSHSRIAVELFGHLWTEYRRNYVGRAHSFAIGSIGAAEPADKDGPDEIGFDAISEFVLPDEAALVEMGRISQANLERIKEDEALWFHQKRCWVVPVDTVEEDLSPFHAAKG